MWLIVRILINLWYKISRALVYPMAMMMQRSFGLIMLAVLGYVLYLFYADEEPKKQRQQAQPHQVVQQVKQVEDGNSAFASDLLLRMNAEELAYYSETYFWVMDNQASGKPHQWQYFNINGEMTPQKTFKNNLGHNCRRFKETLKVGEIQQTLDGIACQKVGGGWCKLGKGWTPVCGLGKDGGLGGFVDDIGSSLKGLFR